MDHQELGGADLVMQFALRSEIRAEYMRPLEGIVSRAFRGKRILIVGIGAGSGLAENLSRFCPNELRLCDPDVVQLPNLPRTTYTFSDAANRRLKVDALAMRIEAVNPLIRVTRWATDVTKMRAAALDEMTDGIDLMIAGTDDFRAQASLNELAVKKDISAVFIGIHAGAQGGRVVWYVPRLTPCYRCVTRDRFERVEKEGLERANLDGQPGSHFDCGLIDIVAGKIAVAILERGQDSSMARFFEVMDGRNDVVVTCDPAYEWGNTVWSAVLTGIPEARVRELRKTAVFAMNSLWLHGERDAKCPVCARRTV